MYDYQIRGGLIGLRGRNDECTVENELKKGNLPSEQVSTKVPSVMLKQFPAWNETSVKDPPHILPGSAILSSDVPREMAV